MMVQTVVITLVLHTSVYKMSIVCLYVRSYYRNKIVSESGKLYSNFLGSGSYNFYKTFRSSARNFMEVSKKLHSRFENFLEDSNGTYSLFTVYKQINNDSNWFHKCWIIKLNLLSKNATKCPQTPSKFSYVFIKIHFATVFPPKLAGNNS